MIRSLLLRRVPVAALLCCVMHPAASTPLDLAGQEDETFAAVAADHVESRASIAALPPAAT